MAITKLAEKKKRYTEIDGLKGILCIIIFCYHYFTRLCGSKLDRSPSLVPNLLFQYGNLAVEFFFCISGFLSALSYRDRDMKINEYIKRRLSIYPQILFAILFCTVLAFLDNIVFSSNSLNQDLTIQNFLRSLLLISIPIEKKVPLSGQVWFYQVLTICYIVYFFVRKTKDYYIFTNITLAFIGYSFIVNSSSISLHSVTVGRGLLAFFLGSFYLN